MTIAIMGTVALDTIDTPAGKLERGLGGSAVFASTAARLFSPVGIVGIVGKDFPQEHLDYLASRDINRDGLQITQGDTFHWSGYYEKDMNQAFTRQTDLNVLLDFDPVVPASLQDAKIVFCANIDPDLQSKFIDQFKSPRLVVLDTMNYWIDTKRDALANTLKKVDVLIINDQELRLLTGISNIIQAMPEVLKMGPKRVIVKKGEHGSVMTDGEQFFLFPAFPLHHLVDPTGAGDSFAGGIIGYLSTCQNLDQEAYRKAVIYGTLLSSFTVQDFSLNSLKKATPELLHNRYDEFHSYMDIPSSLK